MLLQALAFVALASPEPDKVTFLWKPQVGTSAQYRTTNAHASDEGDAEKLVITWSSKVTVDKVENGRVWLKITNGEPVATVGGAEAPGIQVEVPDSTEEHGLDCSFFKPSGYEGLGFGLYGGFVLPERPLDVGETYEIDAMKATFTGAEKVGDAEGFKFKFEYHPKANRPWSSGEIWLSTKDLTLLRRKIVMHQVDFGNGPTDIENEIVRVPSP